MFEEDLAGGIWCLHAEFGEGGDRLAEIRIMGATPETERSNSELWTYHYPTPHDTHTCHALYISKPRAQWTPEEHQHGPETYEVQDDPNDSITPNTPDATTARAILHHAIRTYQRATKGELAY